MSEDRKLLRDTTARFLKDYGSIEHLRKLDDGPAEFDEEAWRTGVELGWTSLLVSEEDGGGSVSGEGLLDLVEICEELGRVLHIAPFLPTNIVAFAISQFGSNVLKERFLPGIITGDLTGAWCSAGIFQGDGQISAVWTDEGYELNGTARFVQDGDKADAYLVTAGDDAEGFKQFVIPRETPGISSVPLTCMDFTRRVAEVRFESAAISGSSLLGTADSAAADVARELAVAIVMQCADSVGALKRVNEMTFEYACDRYAFGRAIGSFQGIKYKCVEMYLGQIGAQSVTAAAAKAVQADSDDAAELVSIAKAYVDDAFSLSAEHCHQIHGGISYTWEHDAHLYSRHSKFNAAMLGTATWHRGRLAQMLGM